MTETRYTLTDETRTHEGKTVHRVRWADGRLGGWLSHTRHLPQEGTGVLYDNAVVMGGTITGGVIRGGDITGGIITGGVIHGGVIRGGLVTRSPATAVRSDGYCFIVHPIDRKVRVWAGCRDFGWDEALAHWSRPDHPHGPESLRIIRFLRSEVEARD